MKGRRAWVDSSRLSQSTMASTGHFQLDEPKDARFGCTGCRRHGRPYLRLRRGPNSPPPAGASCTDQRRAQITRSTMMLTINQNTSWGLLAIP